MAEINVKVEKFEGSMALLCHLIDKNEINIYDIPISLLAEQYIEFINSLESYDMDSMSEFILMAATLLEIKSRMLLPCREPEKITVGDPRDELVQKLLEYKTFKKIAEFFKEKEYAASKVFFKAADTTIPNSIKKKKNADIKGLFMGQGQPVTLDRLFYMFTETLDRKELKTDKIRSKFSSVQKDLYTVEEKQEHLLNLLTIHGELDFWGIFDTGNSKIEIIVTFLATLELVKLKKICLVQSNVFDKIIIRKIKW